MTVMTLQCRYCNKDFDPTQQTINLHGYCKPCCLDNHLDALKAQVKTLEEIQAEIYGEKYAYYKSMGWV